MQPEDRDGFGFSLVRYGAQAWSSKVLQQRVHWLTCRMVQYIVFSYALLFSYTTKCPASLEPFRFSTLVFNPHYLANQQTG